MFIWKCLFEVRKCVHFLYNTSSHANCECIFCFSKVLYCPYGYTYISYCWKPTWYENQLAVCILVGYLYSGGLNILVGYLYSVGLSLFWWAVYFDLFSLFWCAIGIRVGCLYYGGLSLFCSAIFILLACLYSAQKSTEIVDYLFHRLQIVCPFFA